MDLDSMRAKVLVVDDAETNRLILQEILMDTYDIEQAADGYEAVAALLHGNRLPDIVLLDIMMPEMDGFEVLSIIKNNAQTAMIPVIMITAAGGTDNEIKALKMGVMDYVAKPFFPEAVRLRVDNAIELSRYRVRLEHEVDQKVSALTKTKENMLESLADMIEYRDTDSGQHVKRTKYLAKNLIDEMLKKPVFFRELNDLQYKVIVSASAMHDIGKIAIPDSILLKPGRLTTEEYEIIKTHSTIGGEIMDRIMDDYDDVYFRHCKDICLYHHEWWNGNGYPHGLQGTDIPLSARIVSVIDVYDALVSERPYKKPFDYEKAMQIIIDGAGTQFDPDIVEVFSQWRVR